MWRQSKLMMWFKPKANASFAASLRSRILVHDASASEQRTLNGFRWTILLSSRRAAL